MCEDSTLKLPYFYTLKPITNCPQPCSIVDSIVGSNVGYTYLYTDFLEK